MTRKILTLYIAILLTSGLSVSNGSTQDSEQEGPIYDSKNRRDPFIPLIARAIKFTRAGLEGVQSRDDIVLEGIVWDRGGDSIAILNGVIVKEGDEIGSVMIETINENDVILYIHKVKHNIALGEEGE